MPKRQSIKNLQGEVKFRHKLTQQFDGKGIYYSGEPNSEEYLQILKDRVTSSRKIFRELKNRHITLSPFLEIGAGYGQRTLILVNEFAAQGFSTDISWETLESTNRFKQKLGFSKLPRLITCDANNLPFMDNCLPFVFCFQTLHHFPDPGPVIKEVYRVLTPGGYFYFGEEPVMQIFNLNLWRRDHHLTWWEKILKSAIILHFISRIGKSEVEHGILEETFDLPTWEKALNIFQSVSVTFETFPFGWKTQVEKTKNNGWIYPHLIKKIPLQILGGGISALSRKKTEPKITPIKPRNILNLLACPNCRNKPRLNFNNRNKLLSCKICKTTYPQKQNIYILLSKQVKKSLYGKSFDYRNQ